MAVFVNLRHVINEGGSSHPLIRSSSHQAPLTPLSLWTEGDFIPGVTFVWPSDMFPHATSHVHLHFHSSRTRYLSVHHVVWSCRLWLLYGLRWRKIKVVNFIKIESWLIERLQLSSFFKLFCTPICKSGDVCSKCPSLGWIIPPTSPTTDVCFVTCMQWIPQTFWVQHLLTSWRPENWVVKYVLLLLIGKRTIVVLKIILPHC